MFSTSDSKCELETLDLFRDENDTPLTEETGSNSIILQQEEKTLLMKANIYETTDFEFVIKCTTTGLVSNYKRFFIHIVYIKRGCYLGSLIPAIKYPLLKEDIDEKVELEDDSNAL